MLGAAGFAFFYGCLGGQYWNSWDYFEKFSFLVEEFLLLKQQAFVYGLTAWIPNLGSVLLQKNLFKLLMGFILFYDLIFWKS